LQSRLAATLAQIANLQADKTRRLILQSRGSGARRVRVGYVVGAPLWKATYRLSLPGDAQGDKARLQGWAVLENFTGQAGREVGQAPPPSLVDSAEANEGATQIAFTLPYKISVAAGESLLVSVLDRELPARRIDLYQAAAAARYPLAAIELTNNGDTGLPPG